MRSKKKKNALYYTTSGTWKGALPSHKKRISPRQNAGSIDPDSTTTTGLSALDITISPFHIMSADVTISPRFMTFCAILRNARIWV